MTQMSITYDGGLRCTLTHGPSGTVIQTDAPKDNQGQGAAFSPTDLASVSLGACMLTIMGIYARNHGVNIDGAQVGVTKEMVAQPRRRIGKIIVDLRLPASVPQEKRAALEHAGMTCPVHESLHPDVVRDIKFRYDL